MRRAYKILRRVKVILIRFFDALLTPRSRSYFHLLTASNSQAGQESFALLNSKACPQKFYLEIGAGDPIKNSNTFLLESQYQWNGLSIDNNKKHQNRFSRLRQNSFIVADATRMDFPKLLQIYGFPKIIAYLQIDLYEAKDSYKVLSLLPFEDYEFSSITYEHDLHNLENTYYAELSRKLLYSKGYKLLCKNVKFDNLGFGDWWVHPKYHSDLLVSKFHSENRNGLAHFSKKSQILAIKKLLTGEIY